LRGISYWGNKDCEENYLRDGQEDTKMRKEFLLSLTKADEKRLKPKNMQENLLIFPYANFLKEIL
jgi:hypothetical protein